MLRILLVSVLLFASTAGAAPSSASPAPTILVFGDSLSAGYGLANGDAWPALLVQRLQAEKLDYGVVNASISGETSAGGRSRLPAALERTRPAVVVIALGANDGLRGLPVKQLRDNLVAMARACKAAKARVLLVGMRLPPNYGAAYTQAFDGAYAAVAKQEKLPLLPFLLEPVASDRASFQADGLHPVAAAQPKILEHVWPALKPLLKQR